MHSKEMTPASIVGCNIYISAAASHSSTLLHLLSRAQDHCRQLRAQNHAQGRDTNNSNNQRDGHESIASVAIVHAYADIPYNRSSFHLSGTSECVSDVAGRLICNALNEIDLDDDNDSNKSGDDKGGESSRHPFVGLVDHVSVMPILYPKINTQCDMRSITCEAAVNSAREIGKQISETNLVNLYYYGKACPNNTPLATVRRERTSFFKSGGAVDIDQSQSNDITKQNDSAIKTKIALKGDTTIGTPTNFVENFNIRLTSNVSLEQAKTLTQFVRGRNISTKGYGVDGVEALTLPYIRDTSEGGKVYEVACNLTNPKEGSAANVMIQLEKWIDMQRQQKLSDTNHGSVDISKFNYDYFVEDAYRVGTTEEQCLDVLLKGRVDDNNDRLSSVKRDLYWEEYDKEVFRKFKKEFLQ